MGGFTFIKNMMIVMEFGLEICALFKQIQL